MEHVTGWRKPGSQLAAPPSCMLQQLPCRRVGMRGDAVHAPSLGLSGGSPLQPHLWPVQKSGCHLPCLVAVIVDGLSGKRERSVTMRLFTHRGDPCLEQGFANISYHGPR